MPKQSWFSINEVSNGWSIKYFGEAMLEVEIVARTQEELFTALRPFAEEHEKRIRASRFSAEAPQ